MLSFRELKLLDRVQSPGVVKAEAFVEKHASVASMWCCGRVSSLLHGVGGGFV